VSGELADGTGRRCSTAQGMTYQAHADSRDHEGHVDQRDAPGRDVNRLLALDFDRHSALDIGHRIRVREPATGKVREHVRHTETRRVMKEQL
jgi:hypothetical protein